MTVSIFAGSRLDGCLIKDFNWPQGSLVLAIYRGEEELVPRGMTRLQVGDTLVIQLTGHHHLTNQHVINEAAHYGKTSQSK